MAGYLGVEVAKDSKYYFISYNTEDMDRVSAYVKALAGKGLPIWYDYGIEVGSQWEGTIAKRIHDSEAVVIFLSRNIFSKEQSFVHKEFEMARDFYDKKIYVVLLDEIQNKEVPDRYVSWWIDIKHLQCILAPMYSVDETAEKLMNALGFAPVSVPAPDMTPFTAKTVDAIHSAPVSAPKEEKIPVEKGKGIPLALLKSRSSGGGEAERLAYEVEKVFQSRKLTVKISEIKQGPSYYRYYLDFDFEKIPLKKILNCKSYIELALGRAGVLVNHNTEAVFVEVPKKHRSVVYLADVLESRKFDEAKPGQLLFAVGEDIEGRPVVLDICRMPHLLIGGAAGSGKSVQMHAILLSLMMKYTPEEVKLLLIDPKCVEFAAYEHAPHMLYDRVITDPHEAVTALNWMIHEMNRRFTMLEKESVRNLDLYNAKMPANRKLPKIVIVIDELADLMLVNRKECENALARLAQMARAVGIHMIVGTQRPGPDVITGLIKANFPSRMAFKMSSILESRSLLDTGGAESLLGNGDLLYLTLGLTRPLRCQCAFVTDAEVDSIVEYITEYYQK